MRRILGAALAAWLAGCAMTAELETYCETSGQCTCEDGDCCVFPGGMCRDDADCCNPVRFGCSADGACRVAHYPQLVFSSEAIDFGQVDVGSSHTVDLLVRNVSQTPSATLTFGTDWTYAFSAESLCEGAQLPPGGECPVTLTFTPPSMGTHDVELWAHESGLYPGGTWSTYARGRAGYSVRAQLYPYAGGDFPGELVFDGQRCGKPVSWCDFGVPMARDVSLQLLASPGWSVHGFTKPGACQGLAACTVRIAADLEIVGVFRGNLGLQMTGQAVSWGDFVVRSGARVFSYVSTAQGAEQWFPAEGTTTLEYIWRSAYSKSVLTWSGACAGTVGNVCTVDVVGPVTAVARVEWPSAAP